MSGLASANQREDDETHVKQSRSDVTFDLTALSTGLSAPSKGLRTDMLRRAIEGEIIPRLMLNSRAGMPVVVAHGGTTRKVRAEDVLEFTDLLLDGASSEVSACVERLLGQGVSQAIIMLDLFAASARRLGDMWESDDRNFAEVTLAMGVLQEALRLLDSGRVPVGPHFARNILLTPVAGEQHFYPVLILDAFFTRGGWQVETRLSYEQARVEAIIKERHVDVIGLSISRESLLDQLASDIKSVRRKSCNRSLVVLVGGRVFFGHPELVAQVGADATAEDASSAIVVAERLVSSDAYASL